MLGAGCDLRSMWKAFPEGSPRGAVPGQLLEVSS